MAHYSDSNSIAEEGELPSSRKPLGRYLVESGLLSQAQLDMALRDQEYSGYALGEILVLRGWIQQSVIDLVVKKLQPFSEVSQSELRVVIEPGQAVTRGIVGQDGSTTILAEDDTPVNPWDQDTTTTQRISAPEETIDPETNALS